MSADALAADDLLLDADVRHLARVYAEALLNAATQAGNEAAVQEQLAGIAQHLHDSPRSPLGTLFHEGTLTDDQRKALLKTAFDGRVEPVLFDALRVLDEHHRLSLIVPVASLFRTLLEHRHKQYRVQVRTALPLQDDERQKLAGILQQNFGVQAVFEESVDRDLLGGVVVQVGDRLFDGSVRTRIQKLRNQLLTRSSHEIQRGRDRIGSANGDSAVPGAG